MPGWSGMLIGGRSADAGSGVGLGGKNSGGKTVVGAGVGGKYMGGMAEG